MSVFSADRDILRFEPALFGDQHFRWQVLSAGSDGILNGTVFSSETGQFLTNAVQAGGVIYLKDQAGVLEGFYEIVLVDSETQLTVSVLRQSQEDNPVNIGASSGISYRISTFGPQAYEVMYELTQHFGIRPGDAESNYGVEDIIDTEVFRKASTYAVIAGVYATLGSDADDDSVCWKKSLHYQRLFEKTKERCRLSLDPGGDGLSDINKTGGSVRLKRV